MPGNSESFWKFKEIYAGGSTGLRKRVFDAYPRDGLPCAHVLRQNPARATLESRGDNESVPESNLGLVLDTKCIRDFNRGSFDTPDGVGAHHKPGGFLGQGMWDLLRDMHVELLQYLWAENPISFVPKLAQDALRSGVLGLGIGVMGVNQDIRVDKRPSVHAVCPDLHGLARPCESLFQAEPLPVARHAHTPHLHRPRPRSRGRLDR